MRICKNCGHENREVAKFCVKCGNAIRKCCSNCGHTIEDDDLFCPFCGASLKTTHPCMR